MSDFQFSPGDPVMPRPYSWMTGEPWHGSDLFGLVVAVFPIPSSSFLGDCNVTVLWNRSPDPDHGLRVSVIHVTDLCKPSVIRGKIRP